MTPIGRIFIVLNLALAGGFVFVAGTNLQKNAEVVEQRDALQQKYDTDIQQRDAQIEQLQTELETVKRQLVASDANLNRVETELREANNENERLNKVLNANSATLEALRADYAAVSSSIDRATQDAKDARAMAIAASQTQDEAVRAREVAQSDLRDAQDRIATLEATIAERQADIAQLQQEIRQNEVLMSIVRERAPGVLTFAQPKLDGTVRHVDPEGRLVTVAITANPNDAEVLPGYSFAIYSGDNYKGEARITEVDGNFAFCRVTARTGPQIEVGDRATTVTN